MWMDGEQSLRKPLARAGPEGRDPVSLWTIILAGGEGVRLRPFVAAGARCLPVLHERLAGIERFAGSEHEPWAIHQAYVYAPRASFSRAVLEACPALLAVSRLPALTWCDLGSPERVMRTLASTGLAPAWLAVLGEPA